MKHLRALHAFVATALLAACATPGFSDRLAAADGARAVQYLSPEAASGFTAKPGWASSRFAVAAANPLAVDAGYQVLKAGGSAVDAAIAVQMVLTLVEPQSSGIGGGAFLLHFNGKDVEAFDGRETTPGAADERLFLRASGEPMSRIEAVVGGRSVGAPGAVRMLELAHQEYGRLPWSKLFEPAIRLAESGFKVSPRLGMMVKGDAYLKKDPVATAYFYHADGTPRAVGSLLRNPELAAVLGKIAVEGSKGLLEGEVARAIVDKVQKHPTHPGTLSLGDLASYQARKRTPICHDHKARGRDYRVCGFPPPSSGAIAIGQILGILGHTHADAIPLENGLPGANWLHLYTEASRLAFADRALYLGDPDFVDAPGGDWNSLLARGYLAERARLIAPQSMKIAKPGVPGAIKTGYAPMPEQPEYGTSHISIVDAHGNAVAMTTTIEDGFGSRQMVKGFMLNNQLSDFSYVAADGEGKPIANRVQPGKRPRSSMAPTLVIDKATGQIVASGGSPGGPMIIHFTAKALYGILNWGLNAQQAINLPNFGSLNGPSLLEQGRFPPATVEDLRARGAEVQQQPMTSGLHVIQRTPGGWFGGADPRREGIVMGD